MEATPTTTAFDWDWDFPNELWQEIAHYLPFTDLLQLRAVCRRWRDNVEQLRNFQAERVVHINAHNIGAVLHQLERQSPVPWQNINVKNIRHAASLQALLDKIGKRVRRLELREAVESDLSALVNLQQLTIYGPLKTDLSELRSLRCLRLIADDETNGANGQADLLKQLSQDELHFTQLRRLQFHYDVTNGAGAGAEAGVLEVLARYAPGLQEFNLTVTGWAGESFTLALCTIGRKLRNLQQLKLSGAYRARDLKALFESLPVGAPIREIELQGLVALESTALARLVAKCAGTLEQFRLAHCNRMNAMECAGLWRAVPKLRVLDVEDCSATLLRYGLVECGAPNQIMLLEELCLHGSYPTEAELLALLLNLRNLRSLDLEDCLGGVTTATLCLICAQMTRLRVLNLNHCRQLTDASFCGTQLCGIRRLRGLCELHLLGCAHLTDSTLAEALHLPELRVLTLGYAPGLTAAGLRQLTRNCPAIERLDLVACLNADDSCVALITKGFRRLRRLNLSHCHLITKRSLASVARYAPGLTRLILCGVDLQLDDEDAWKLPIIYEF